MNSLILVAAGKGTRMNAAKNKLFLEYQGYPLIYYTLKNIQKSRLLSELIVVASKEELSIFLPLVESLNFKIPVKFASGGARRIDSVRNGLAQVSDRSEKVLVHDGARPFVDGEIIDLAFISIDSRHPAVMVGIPCVDTMKAVSYDTIVKTLDRSNLIWAQTPQGAYTDIFQKAVSALENDSTITDDASILENAGIKVSVVPGKESYFKVTTPEDWDRFKTMMNKDNAFCRIGQGYDIHQMDESSPLVIGGVKIRDHHGLKGHSDADVLIHAIIDALLGAAGLRDIGYYFPDTDDRYKGISSLKLLENVGKMITESGFLIGNIDTTVIAEKPKLAGYIDTMKANIAGVLDIPVSKLGIKAKTNEKLDAAGREEGIASFASAILFRRDF